MNNERSIVDYGDFETHITSELDNTILSIYDYAQKSNEIISKIENIIDATQRCYIGPYAETYRKKFKNLCSQKYMINKNILSYKTDLVIVKSKYLALAKKVAKIFNEK